MSAAAIFVVPIGITDADRVPACLANAGYRIVSSALGAHAAIVASDSDELALSAIQRLGSSDARLPIVLVTARGSERLAVAAFQNGVSGYLNESWTPPELLVLLDRLVIDRPVAHRPLAGPILIGNSHAICELRQYIRQISTTDCNVLILGETGTGKELVAESIHANSPRRNNPLVCLNTAAIPDALIESELFGHEKGAFTGASAAQVGKLVHGNEGTVFFDEIGDVNPSIQAKLLRAIESRRVFRLGSNRAIDLNIRLVAATNQDLEKAMSENRFRRDLYYRLSVVRIGVPALRDRREDIPLLIGHFFDHFNARWGRHLSGLSPRAMDAVISHTWPGNVRELRNVVEALFASLSPEVSGMVDIPPQVLQHLSLAATSPQTERDKILKALVAAKWNKSKASEQLCWSRMTLYRKLQKHQLFVTVKSRAS
jgi:DNA-binding NtrC family response regulator